ncbi:acetylcholinesterase-1-like [Amblyomma americanum]
MMNPFSRLLLVLALSADACRFCYGESERPRVRTKYGLVEGIRQNAGSEKVDSFLGIPYATPPVGELRFEKPLPAKPWKGAFNATIRPTPCMQSDFPLYEDIVLDYTHSSEDCLYYNVWRPTRSCPNDTDTCDAKLPVMVFIHGGGFQFGDSSLFVYDLSNLAVSTNIITVSFNYRLNFFGFLTTETADLPGNMGMWDQVLFLQWVKENIAYFGGDPDEVTVAGHSAGGVSAGMLAASPVTRGLFKRIIVQSGTPLTLLAGSTYYSPDKFYDVSHALGCHNGEQKKRDLDLPKTIKCLKKLNARKIIRTLLRLKLAERVFSPLEGDDFFPYDPLALDTWKNLHVKEVFAGSNLNEGTGFLHYVLKFHHDLLDNLKVDYRATITALLSLFADVPLVTGKKMTKAYFGGYEVKHSDQKVLELLSEMLGDIVFKCPTHLFAELAALQGVRTYRYLFAYRPSYSIFPKWFGVVHAEELPFALGSLIFSTDPSRASVATESLPRGFLGRSYTTNETAFMRQLMETWGSFVRRGKPSIPLTDDQWPRYSTSRQDIVQLMPFNYDTKLDKSQEKCELYRPFMIRKGSGKKPPLRIVSPGNTPSSSDGPSTTAVASSANCRERSVVTPLAACCLLVAARHLLATHP